MDDLRTRAQLVADDRAGTGIGTVVTRAEIAEAAAGAEFPATLLLDLDKVGAADGEVTAHARVAVDWDQEMLERLLAVTDDNEIELWFDEGELNRAFEEPEVEAHGLRERAAVLAVAAVAAGASASPALARVAADTGGGGGAATTGFGVNPATGERSVPIGGAERALQQDEKLTQGLGSTQIDVNPQATTGHGPVVQPAGAERALLQDEKAFVTQTHESMAGESADTSSTTLSSGEIAGAVAGGLLLISAAGFGATRRRTPPAQPA
ncbi:MAG TPA: hypothetical protein VJ814_02060 [Gaiellaceae bacterium]|nr:hypothetical protein [Gaiellaceae bacterium]